MALAVKLRLARVKVQAQPEVAELLDESSAELQASLDELRELARGIHPAVLTDRGLPAALEGLASRAPLPVEIASLPSDGLTEAAATAVYFVVSEALTNIAKYAQAEHATVAVRRIADKVLVEVSDDGVGGADVAGGSGLRGLSDRVSALDGRLGLSSPVGEAPGAGRDSPVDDGLGSPPISLAVISCCRARTRSASTSSGSGLSVRSGSFPWRRRSRRGGP